MVIVMKTQSTAHETSPTKPTKKQIGLSKSPAQVHEGVVFDHGTVYGTVYGTMHRFNNSSKETTTTLALSYLRRQTTVAMKHRLALFALLIIAIFNVGGCHSFSSRGIEAGRRAIMPIRWGKATISPKEPATSSFLSSSSTRSKIKLQNKLFRQTETAEDSEQQQPDKLQRRRLVLQFFCSGGFLASACAFPNVAQADSAEVKLSPTRIVRLSSGLQFSDQRVGSGPFVLIPKMMDDSATTIKNTDNSEGLEPDDPSIVLMHLRALKQDGSVLLDTFDEGKPLLFRLGSIPSELYLLNEGGAMAKGKIPLGVQDAILAQGSASWEGGFGKADPMRTGGIRKVVVPSELAYGTKGVSRYEAFQLGLKEPVARNELLRYEIELLRCNDEVMNLAGSVEKDKDKFSDVPARACCIEEFYPCKMNGG